MSSIDATGTPGTPALSGGTGGTGGSGDRESVAVSVTVPKIAGYEILGPLGQGGMGTVWRATQLGTRREVALKLMSDAMPESQRDRARFQREVELTARLDHPNIARVYDSGVDRGVYYYTMQLVDGVDLDQYVRSNKLATRQTVELMGRVCQAVEHAHQHGVLHRDLKPSNILVTKEGQPYVVDFGLAKGLQERDRNVMISRQDSVAGTLAYMAPEQAAGKVQWVDTRADVYALGVILYYLLTDQFPHDLSGPPLEVSRRITQQEVRRPSHVSHAIDHELDALLLKALAKSPQDRYASVGELATDLRRYLTGQPLLARPMTLSYLLHKQLRRYRVPIAVTAVVLLAVMTFIGVAYFRERRLRVLADQATLLAQQETLRAQHELIAKRRALYFNQIALAEAYGPTHIERAQEILDQCPLELRHWEWRYLHGLTDQSTATLGPVGGAVLTVAVSPTGTTIASADNRAIYVWDASGDPTGPNVDQARTGAGGLVEGLTKSWVDRQQPRIIARLEVDPRTVAFDRQVNQVATVDGSTIKIWNLATGQVTRTMWETGHAPKVVAFVGDGRSVVTADDRGAMMWSVETGDVVRVFTGHDMSVNSLSASADGRVVVVGGCAVVEGVMPARRGAAAVWDASTGELILRTTSIEEPVESLALSHDGQLLACGTRRRVVLLDVSTGEPMGALDTAGYAMAFSPDDKRLATSGQEAVITVWDVASAQPLKTLRGHQRLVGSLAFGFNDNGLISGGWDAVVKIWAAGREQVSFEYDADETPVLSPDGRYLFVDRHSDRKSIVRSIEPSVEPSGGPVLWRTFPATQLRVDPPAGQVLANVLFFPSTTRFQTSPPTGDACLLASLQDGHDTVSVWDMTKQTTVWSVAQDGHKTAVSLDGRFVAVANEEEINVLDAGLGDSVVSIPIADSSGVRSLAFSPDGVRLVAAGDDSVVRVWQIPSGQLHQAIPWDDSRRSLIIRVVVSGDGRRLVAEDLHGNLKVWDANTGQNIPLASYEKPIHTWALSPDGKRLAEAGYGWIRLLDLQTGQQTHDLRGHGEFVTALAFSPDGLRLASGGDDTTIKLWDTVSGAEVITLTGHRAAVTALAFSPDADRLTSVSHEDRTVRVWLAGGSLTP